MFFTAFEDSEKMDINGLKNYVKDLQFTIVVLKSEIQNHQKENKKLNEKIGDNLEAFNKGEELFKMKQEIEKQSCYNGGIRKLNKELRKDIEDKRLFIDNLIKQYRHIVDILERYTNSSKQKLEEFKLKKNKKIEKDYEYAITFFLD